MLATRLLLNRVAKTVNHLDIQTETAFEVFLKTRKLVYATDKNADPIPVILHDQIKTAVETRLLTSLDQLKAEVAANTPLVPPNQVASLKDQLIEIRSGLLRRLFEETFGEHKNARQVIDASMDSIPEGQKFGIECEGFRGDGSPMPSQLMSIWGLLRNKKFSDLGVKVRFPMASFVPRVQTQLLRW